MNRFSLGGAFSETFAFLKTNWLSMLLWMGGAILVMAIVFNVTIGSSFVALTAGANDPDDLTSLFGALGGIFLFALFAMAVVYGTGMMIWRMGLSRDASSGDIGWALLAGVAYAFALFVIMLVAYLVLVLAAIVVMVVFGVSGSAFGGLDNPATTGGVIVGMIVAYVLVLLAALWLQGRLMAAGPIMADRRMANPFPAIAESWRMSASVQWRILGFLIVFSILSYVILFVLGMLASVIIAAFGGESASPGVAAMIALAIIVYLPFLMVWTAIPPGIYRALGGSDDAAEVFS